MKPIIKKGSELVSSIWLDKDRKDKDFIVNLWNKWVYKNSSFKKNTLTIETEDGEIVITFSGIISKVTFDYQEKDQLIFKISYSKL